MNLPHVLKMSYLSKVTIKSFHITKAGERASSIKLRLFSTARLELATASLGIFRASLLDHTHNGSKTDIRKVVPSH